MCVVFLRRSSDTLLCCFVYASYVKIEMSSYITVAYIGCSENVHRLNNSIVEGPIEGHKITVCFTRQATGPLAGEAWTGPNR